MMFIFEGPNNEFYSNPVNFILYQEQQIIQWGTELKIYPVYCKGGPVIPNCHQVIKSMFYHEGNYSGAGSVYWIGSKKLKGSKDWYEMISNDNNTNNTNNTTILQVTVGKVVRFDMGPENPLFFRSKEDLVWYISNIYNVDTVHVVDDNSGGEYD